MDRDEYALTGALGTSAIGACTTEEGAAAISVTEAPADFAVDAELQIKDEAATHAADASNETAGAQDAEMSPHLAEAEAAPPAPAPEELSAPQIIEALLFASDAPLSAARLAELLGGGTAGEVRGHIAALNEKYAAAGLSFRVEEIARGYQMLTLPAYRPWLARLDKHRAQSRLSPAALEALSIIAYKQPIIRADVEAIRGVACGEVLNRLREMNLIRIVGRAEIVGRPILYGTTRKFLDVFGLADLADLPPMETLSLRRSAAASSSSDEPAEATGPDAAVAETAVAAAGA